MRSADATGQQGMDDKCRAALQLEPQEPAAPIDRCKVTAHQMIGHLAAEQVGHDERPLHLNRCDVHAREARR